MSTSLQISLKARSEFDQVAITDLLNCGYGRLLGEAGQFDQKRLEAWLGRFDACKVITMQKNLKMYLVGFAGIRSYNQRSRSAELVAFAVGPEASSGPAKTLSSVSIVAATTKWIFMELGLNRVWMGVADYNPILDVLEEGGWVVEGVQVGNLAGTDGRIDETICSINATGWAGVRNGN